jgi:uroporphyrinogen III methyltransferase / synthase
MHDSDPRQPGRVCFVGAGPGVADLLTLRAVERLRSADVIVHDALVPTRLLDGINPNAERIQVARELDLRPDPGLATGRLLARLALEGRVVVRLKGGDPSVFARLAEELEPLREAGVPIEVVPGVTAAVAAAAAAAVPLTTRGAASSLTIVTGREADEKADAVDYAALAAVSGTLVVYMGVEQVCRWSRALLDAGRAADTPVTIVSHCSWPDQRVAFSTLADCAADFATHGWQSPAVVIVGVAADAATGPLHGRLVLVTRPAGQEEDVTAAVRALGGECLHVPVIRICDPPSWRPLDAAIAAADTFDWIVFTSANGVNAFLRRLAAAGRDGRALGTARLAAIGPATARRLVEAGYRCDLTPESFRSEGLAASLAGAAHRGRFLLVRAARGRELLRPALEAAGHDVVEVVAYENMPLEALDAADAATVARAPIDWLTLTSPSIAEAAVRLFGPRLEGWRIATISPVTTAALERAGIRPTVEAAQATTAALVDAIREWEEAAAAGLLPSAGSARPANFPRTLRG